MGKSNQAVAGDNTRYVIAVTGNTACEAEPSDSLILVGELLSLSPTLTIIVYFHTSHFGVFC